MAATQNFVSPAENEAATIAAGSIPLHVRDRLSPVVKHLYAAGDFHRVDMRTVAREAGMSFRTIYRYFGDKETLLFWFIQFWLEELYPPVLKVLDSSADLEATLLAVLTLHFEFYERHPSVGRIIFMTVPLERWMRDPSFAQSELMKRVLKLIREAQQRGELRADIDSRVIFDVINAIFNRAFLMWEYRHRSYSLVEQAAPLLSIVWNGICAHRRPADGPYTDAAAVDAKQRKSKKQRPKS